MKAVIPMQYGLQNPQPHHQQYWSCMWRCRILTKYFHRNLETTCKALKGMTISHNMSVMTSYFSSLLTVEVQVDVVFTKRRKKKATKQKSPTKEKSPPKHHLHHHPNSFCLLMFSLTYRFEMTCRIWNDVIKAIRTLKNLGKKARFYTTSLLEHIFSSSTTVSTVNRLKMTIPKSVATKFKFPFEKYCYLEAMKQWTNGAFFSHQLSRRGRFILILLEWFLTT